MNTYSETMNTDAVALIYSTKHTKELNMEHK